MAYSYTRVQPAPPTTESGAQSVTTLTRSIKQVLEQGFADVVVEGEISNFLFHRSGHRYWTLKDPEAQISCVFWKTRASSFDIKDGMKVVCRGRLSVYPPRGNYQLDVFQVRPLGIGDLQRAFEALYKKLAAEGLFAEDRKREIPDYPKTIGIVTSESGAALHDILTVLRRRYPLVRVILRPTAVQGIGAELDVARAIQEFNFSNPAQRPDVLIVGRGGGSIEDLWSFNEEAVARAIFASEIPVISAVGHEVDVTIADLVADLRAPTPTAAAELATPDREELLGSIQHSRYLMLQNVRQRLTALRRELDRNMSTYGLNSCVTDEIGRRNEQITSHVARLNRLVAHELHTKRLTVDRDVAKIAVMNPYAVLDRGFAILQTPDGRVIPTMKEAGMHEAGLIIFADGRLSVRLT